MVSIPGWAYAIAGGLVAGYSRYIARSHPSGAMTVFFWVGILLIVVGAFKLALRFMLGKRDELRGEDEEEKGAKRGGSKGDRPAYARDAIICARCNAKLHPQSRYCNWCGTRQ